MRLHASLAPLGVLRRSTPRGDLIAASGLFALAVAFATSTNGGALKGVTLTMVAAALLWRTRAPLRALSGVAVGALLGNLLTPDLVQCFAVLPALMLVSFSVAARCQARPALIALALVVVVAIVQSVVDPKLNLATNVLLLPLLAAIWLAGRTMRSHRAMSSELEQRSSELERRREERAAAAVALERARVGRELHDVVTVGVGAIVERAGIARGSLLEDRDAACEFAAIEQSGRGVLNEMRDLLGVLRAPERALALKPQPTLAELDDLLAAIRARGSDVRLASHGTARELTPGVDVSAYRIVESALEAALAHSPGEPVSVQVRYGARDVELQIVSAAGEPSGERPSVDELLPVRERVVLYGGAMHAGVRTDGKYVLRARLPLQAARG